MQDDAALRLQMQDAWNQAAQGYLAYWSPRFEPYLRRAVEAFRPASLGPLAVEGCGPGDELLLIARKFPGRTIMSTDLSPAMVDLARRRVREAGLASVLVAEDQAGEVAGRVRQAGGVFSSFVLQLLPNPMGVVADWSCALRRDGSITVLFWPRHTGSSAFSRLQRILERFEDARPHWEEPVLEALYRLGLRVVLDELVAFDMEHRSPEECWQQLLESGPLRAVERRLGKDRLAEAAQEWLRDHGFERKGDAWVHRPEARLWVLERSDRG
jgi:SAM-dependent methyltransferase